MSDEQTSQILATATTGRKNSSLATFKSETLFGSANEIEIVHNGAAYRLKVTRQGKLILNK